MHLVSGIVLGAAFCVPLYGQGNATFSFEDNMEGWESDVAMPQMYCLSNSTIYPQLAFYPECNGHPGIIVDTLAAVRRTRESAFDGSHSVKFTLDGGFDEGTAWIIRPFAVAPGVRYRVRLQFYVSSGAPWNRIAYLGPTRPKGGLLAQGPPQTDFLTVLCPVTYSSGWGQCNYLTEVTADATGTIWAAAGLWVNNEGTFTCYFDNVTVTIDPVVDQTTTTALGMVPNSGSGQPPFLVLTFVFSDTKGWQDLGVVNILVNDSLNPTNSCYVAYVPAIDILYLVNDAGTALLAGTSAQKNPATLVNSQCTIQSFGVKYSADGQTLSLRLNVTFSSTFSGNRTFFLAARDINDSNNTGWQQAGTWAVPK